MTRRESLAAGFAAVAAGAIAGRWSASIPTPVPHPKGHPVARPDDAILYVTSAGDDTHSGMQWNESLATVSAALERLGTSVGTVMLGPGDTLATNRTIDLDVSLHRIVGDRSTISFVDAPSGDALIRCHGSAPQPLHQPWAVLEGLELEGPARDGDHIGISFATPVSDGKPAAAHVEVRNVSIHDFGTGVSIGDNSYCITFSNCIVGKCGTCVLIPQDITNAGERIEFLSSTIFDSEIGLDVRSRASEVFLLGSSLDYCRTLATVTEGQVHAVSSHLEFDRSRDAPPIRVSGATGTFSMIGGKLTGIAKSKELKVTSIVANDSAGTTGASFAHVWMTNLSTTTGDFSTGPGHTAITGELTAAAPSRSFTVIGESNNLLLDGAFAQQELVDDWLWEGKNNTLSLMEAPTIQAINGASGLDVTSPRDRTGNDSVTLAVPATPGALARCRYSLTTSGDASGSIEVDFRAGRMGVGLVPRALGRVDLGATAKFDASSLRSQWTVGRSPLPVQRMPAGATHLFLTVRSSGLRSGKVFIGGVNLCAT